MACTVFYFLIIFCVNFTVYGVECDEPQGMVLYKSPSSNNESRIENLIVTHAADQGIARTHLPDLKKMLGGNLENLERYGLPWKVFNRSYTKVVKYLEKQKKCPTSECVRKKLKGTLYILPFREDVYIKSSPIESSVLEEFSYFNKVCFTIPERNAHYKKIMTPTFYLSQNGKDDDAYNTLEQLYENIEYFLKNRNCLKNITIYVYPEFKKQLGEVKQKLEQLKTLAKDPQFKFIGPSMYNGI